MRDFILWIALLSTGLAGCEEKTYAGGDASRPNGDASMPRSDSSTSTPSTSTTSTSNTQGDRPPTAEELRAYCEVDCGKEVECSEPGSVERTQCIDDCLSEPYFTFVRLDALEQTKRCIEQPTCAGNEDDCWEQTSRERSAPVAEAIRTCNSRISDCRDEGESVDDDICEAIGVITTATANELARCVALDSCGAIVPCVNAIVPDEE